MSVKPRTLFLQLFIQIVYQKKNVNTPLQNRVDEISNDLSWQGSLRPAAEVETGQPIRLTLGVFLLVIARNPNVVRMTKQSRDCRVAPLLAMTIKGTYRACSSPD